MHNWGTDSVSLKHDNCITVHIQGSWYPFLVSWYFIFAIFYIFKCVSAIFVFHAYTFSPSKLQTVYKSSAEREESYFDTLSSHSQETPPQDFTRTSLHPIPESPALKHPTHNLFPWDPSPLTRNRPVAGTGLAPLLLLSLFAPPFLLSFSCPPPLSPSCLVFFSQFRR